MTSGKPRIVIIGASARAAAWSYHRLGYSVHAIDLFADRDLKAIATVQRLPFEEYPHGFLRLLKEAPEGPVLYTGGLENEPDLIDAIARDRQIIGNRGDSLRKARDPFFVHNLLVRNELPALDVSRERPVEGDWLWKPLKGSAGIGIREMQYADSLVGGYFQRFCPGVSHSALFSVQPEGAKLLGICLQLIGTIWLNAPPFRYAGNIGPATVLSSVKETLQRMGNLLASDCRLQGLFGIDFLLYEDRPWLCEVNPRYTASVEVLERAQASGQVVGKAILYADRASRFPVIAFDESFADVPEVGEPIEAGQPICTRFATGEDFDEVLGVLLLLARSTSRLISQR